MANAIETLSLTKQFTQPKTLSNLILHPFRKSEISLAVDDVALQVKEGELFGLIGPNGAGKTTLIKMLCCLILPTSGTAKVAGFDVLKNEDNVRASIGLVSGDERSFYWRLTGRQNLHFFASLYELSKNQAREKINNLLGFLEIEEPDKRFQEYSTGVKHRLVIARSLLNNPRILFMDEPTKSLDPGTAQDVREFIKEKLGRQQGKTIFFATHNLDEAKFLADRLAIMDKGEIRAIGTIEELRPEISRCFFQR